MVTAWLRLCSPGAQTASAARRFHRALESPQRQPPAKVWSKRDRAALDSCRRVPFRTRALSLPSCTMTKRKVCHSIVFGSLSTAHQVYRIDLQQQTRAARCVSGRSIKDPGVTERQFGAVDIRRILMKQNPRSVACAPRFVMVRSTCADYRLLRNCNPGKAFALGRFEPYREKPADDLYVGARV